MNKARKTTNVANHFALRTEKETDIATRLAAKPLKKNPFDQRKKKD